MGMCICLYRVQVSMEARGVQSQAGAPGVK